MKNEGTMIELSASYICSARIQALIFDRTHVDEARCRKVLSAADGRGDHRCDRAAQGAGASYEEMIELEVRRHDGIDYDLLPGESTSEEYSPAQAAATMRIGWTMRDAGMPLTMIWSRTMGYLNTSG